MVYCATPRKEGSKTRNLGTLAIWEAVTALQALIAIIPLARDREWGVLLVTFSGITASLLAGTLPQWRLEKIPLKKRSDKLIALTSGNGSRDIMIIYGRGVALYLEELAAGESPRSDRVWHASDWFSTLVADESGEPQYHENGNEVLKRGCGKDCH